MQLEKINLVINYLSVENYVMAVDDEMQVEDSMPVFVDASLDNLTGSQRQYLKTSEFSPRKPSTRISSRTIIPEPSVIPVAPAIPLGNSSP